MHKPIRYIGSKQKILPFLEQHLFSHLKQNDSFLDGFAGTGIVSQYIAENHPTVNISGSDLSYYSYLLFNILNLGLDFDNEHEIIELFSEFETTPLIEGPIFNEFSATGTPKTYFESRNFFHAEAGKTIDTFKKFILHKINNNEINTRQANILLFFLLSYACKVANTTSVFGAFLKSEPKYFPFNISFAEKVLKDLDIISKLKKPAVFFLGDIVDNLSKIPKQHIIYLDPPYSTRRYESNYHILNFIVDLKFNHQYIKEGSKTGQPTTIPENPFGSKKNTEIIFTNMINLGVEKSNILAISYNTDGLITQQWMEKFCQQQGYTLTTHRQNYKRFKSKLEVTNTKELEEILWLIQK